MHEKAIKSPAYEIADRTADGYLFSSVPTPAKRAKPIKTPISRKRFRRLNRSIIVMCCTSNETQDQRPRVRESVTRSQSLDGKHAEGRSQAGSPFAASPG